LLEENASQPIKKISRKTGIPPSTVFHRIKRLKENGVILGQTIRVDKRKAGVPLGVFIFVKTDNRLLTYGRKGGLSKRIMEIPFVESASETTGSIDIIVKAYVPAIDQMQELVVNQIRELEGVISTETYVVLTDRSRK
jgi:Lrp/AsnC family transcriptional regulator